MKVWIGEEYDGFEIRVYDDEMSSTLYSVRINQEDSIQSLEEVFNFLGHETEYEEVF